jgi:hypothetical protein
VAEASLGAKKPAVCDSIFFDPEMILLVSSLASRPSGGKRILGRKRKHSVRLLGKFHSLATLITSIIRRRGHPSRETGAKKSDMPSESRKAYG